MSSLLPADKMDIVRRHQSAAPVEVVPIATELGHTVHYANNWPSQISGYVVRQSEGSPYFNIYVNADHHSNRRRFTIAHELAHTILHANQIGDGITEDGLLRSGLSNSIEAQANRLAADILMPWHLLGPALENETRIEELAKTFRVSAQAMAIRLGVPQ